MRIPEVRDELMALAATHSLPRLAVLADELKRKPRIMSSVPKCNRMSPALAEAVRILHRKDPDLSQMEIAKRLNINPGRVSEVLSGKRT